MAAERVRQLISSSPVVVFSKTFCPYCTEVKDLLKKLGASYKAIELDEEKDGSEMQKELLELTKQRTVPNVFIDGKHIGGCDAVTMKHKAGELENLLIKAGAIANNSTQLSGM